MWHEGTIGVPKGDGKYTVVHYWVKAYDEGSQYGIDGGKISKATLKINGEVVYNYDRGWMFRRRTRQRKRRWRS